MESYVEYINEAKSQTKSLYVDKSTIPNSGNGLFTKKDFKKGQLICQFKGDLLDEDELSKIDTTGPRGHYLIGLSNNMTLDVYNSKSLARYANDAEGFKKVRGRRNNSTIYSSKNGKSAYIAATRDIKAGEEIFVSYGDEYWDNISFD